MEKWFGKIPRDVDFLLQMGTRKEVEVECKQIGSSKHTEDKRTLQKGKAELPPSG